MRDFWRRVIWPLLVKWGHRLRGLRWQMETQEVGILLSVVIIALWIADTDPSVIGSPAAAALRAICPRYGWVSGLWLIAGVGFLGFLEEIPWMRRLSSLASALLWWLTGLYLSVHLHGSLLPRLMMLIGFLASCVWTCLAQTRIRTEYRQGRAAPARFWWLTGLGLHR